MTDPFDDELFEAYDEPPEDDDDLTSYRRPWWMALVAAIVLIGLVIAAVPWFLWPWIVFVGFVGFLVWRAVGPRRPR